MILIPYIKKHNCIINIYLNTIPYTGNTSKIQMFHIRVGCGRNKTLVRPLKPVNPSLQIMRPMIGHVCYPRG